MMERPLQQVCYFEFNQFLIDRQTIVASKLGKLSQKEIVNDRFLITSYALIPSTNEPVKAVEDRQFYDHNYKSENGPISDGYKLENTL